MTRGVVPRFINDGYHDTDAIPRDESGLPQYSPPEEVRDLFAKHFGIDPLVQVHIEKELEKGRMSALTNSLVVHKDVREYYARYVDFH